MFKGATMNAEELREIEKRVMFEMQFGHWWRTSHKDLISTDIPALIAAVRERDAEIERLNGVIAGRESK